MRYGNGRVILPRYEGFLATSLEAIYSDKSRSRATRTFLANCIRDQYSPKSTLRLATLSELILISVVAARYSEMGRTGVGWPAKLSGRRQPSRRLKRNTMTPRRGSRKR